MLEHRHVFGGCISIFPAGALAFNGHDDVLFPFYSRPDILWMELWNRNRELEHWLHMGFVMVIFPFSGLRRNTLTLDGYQNRISILPR